MKIKYLSGKKIGAIVEIEDVQAKGLIEDGLAEEVVEGSALDISITNFEGKLNEVITSAIDRATKGLENVKKNSTIVVGPSSEEKIASAKDGGFKSYGHFINQTIQVSLGREVDETMKAYLKATGNSSAAAPDAGPTVPVQYTGNILQVTGNGPDFFAKTFQIPITTNNVKIPVLKNYDHSNTNVANGVVAAKVAEGTAITPSKSNWEQLDLSLASLKVLVPVTNELLEDNIVSLETVLNVQAGYQIRKAINKAILQGGEGSVATGIIDHEATVKVGRSNASKFTFRDALEMYAAFAFDDADYEGAEWFIHPTALPELGDLQSGHQNIYVPAGGASGNPFSTLLGLKINVTGSAKPLGTGGDVVLADMKKYVTAYKGGVNQAVSPHLYFNKDESAFRWTFRLAGKPGLSSPITLEDGSTSVSPFVQLDDVVGSD